jgi:CRP-like cAMP-binding protein
MILGERNKKGASFGHLALQYDPTFPKKVTRRAATITTGRDSIFAIINKKDYREVLDKID